MIHTPKDFCQSAGAAVVAQAKRDASAAPAARAKSPLVLLTESSATFHTDICPQTGVITGFDIKKSRREYVEIKESSCVIADSRTNRFKLQTVAKKILENKENPKGGKWRVVGCGRRRIADNVGVMFSRKVGKAHYKGLMICGSAWTCLPCAAKISERRKVEVQEAVNSHAAAGGGVYMCTLTFSHIKQDKISDLTKKLAVALTWLRKHRDYKNLTAYVNFEGLIRALEVTHGELNGWHPHLHELWFTAVPLSRAALRILKRDLFNIWAKACAVAGLGVPNRKRGVDVIEAFSAADYVSKFGHDPKWGVASELAKSQSKLGKAKGRTPFELLALAGAGSDRAAGLFSDYAAAFFGMAQIFWSRGLKARFQIADYSDEEIAAKEDEKATLVFLINKVQWRFVLTLPSESRGLVLKIAETGGVDALILFFKDV